MNQCNDDNSNECNDDNSKVIEREFDTGSLNKKDVWRICDDCIGKPMFTRYIISEKVIGDKK